MRSPAPFTLCALVAAALAARDASAQQQQQANEQTTLTLDEALAAARRNVPSVAAAIGQAQAARAQIALARAPLLPVVSATGTLQGFGQNSTAMRGNSVPCSATTQTTGGVIATMPIAGGQGSGCSAGLFGYAFADASVTLRWTIWDFGRTALDIESARRAARGAQADVRTAEQSAMLAAATAYFAVLADRQLEDSAAQVLQQREREFEIARARVEAGTDPEINRVRAEIAVSTARLDLATAHATVQNDQAALAAALALDPAHPPRVVQPPEITLDTDPERAAQRAIDARSEVAAARLRVASAESAVASARAAYRPALTTTASGGVRYSEYGTGAAALNENATVGGGIAVPLYDPLIGANIRAAEANLAIARADLAQQMLTVRTDAVQAAITARATRDQYLAAQHNADLAAANLDLAEGRYRAGTTTILELVDAQSQDVQARLAVIQRRFQWEAAQMRLLAAQQRLGAAR
jgi:outer membrane protein TolC